MELMEFVENVRPAWPAYILFYFCVCRDMFMHPSYGVSPHAPCRAIAYAIWGGQTIHHTRFGAAKNLPAEGCRGSLTNFATNEFGIP